LMTREDPAKRFRIPRRTMLKTYVCRSWHGYGLVVNVLIHAEDRRYPRTICGTISWHRYFRVLK
jgi:hypothetical protein